MAIYESLPPRDRSSEIKFKKEQISQSIQTEEGRLDREKNKATQIAIEARIKMLKDQLVDLERQRDEKERNNGAGHA